MSFPYNLNGGTITAAQQAVGMEVLGMAALSVQVTGTWVGTLVAEVSDDKATWQAVSVVAVSTGASAATITGNGYWRADVDAFRYARVRASAWTSGTATVASAASAASDNTSTAATIADGADVAQGSTTDANTANTVMGRLTKIRDLLLSQLAFGQNTKANSLPVTLASDQGNVPIATGVLTSETLSNVANSLTNVTLLAASSSRRACKIYNDGSTGNLLVKHGATASVTSFTVKIAPGGFYEMPQPVYTGIIDGIWDGAGSIARVTEGA